MIMICVVGGGAIGAIAANYLSRKHDVSVIDVSQENLNRIPKVKRLFGLIDDHLNSVEEAEAMIVALPGSISHEVVKKLLSMGKKVVDISFSENDPMELQDLSMEKGGLLIPDAGFAPGLSNIIAGRIHKTGKYRAIEIYVAGLPQDPEPPLEYLVTWSVEGLIDEYTRPARIIRGGKVVSLDPLESVSSFHFEGLGDFEAFYSDGLRTLLSTLDGVDMFEKTLRFPGHIDKIKFLRTLGYFSSDTTDGTSPRKVSERVLEKLRTGEEDFCILVVRGIGKETIEYSCIDRFDRTSQISSMGRMTGYTAAVIAEGITEGKIDGKGILPPEKIGYDEDAFEFVRERLAAVGIRF